MHVCCIVLSLRRKKNTCAILIHNHLQQNTMLVHSEIFRYLTNNSLFARRRGYWWRLRSSLAHSDLLLKIAIFFYIADRDILIVVWYLLINPITTCLKMGSEKGIAEMQWSTGLAPAPAKTKAWMIAGKNTHHKNGQQVAKLLHPIPNFQWTHTSHLLFSVHFFPSVLALIHPGRE